MRKIILCLIIILLGFSSTSNGQLLTLDLSNVAANTCANHMNFGIYAFRTFSWDGSSSANATAENMVSLNGVDQISYSQSPFSLAFYKHINVINPNGDPTNIGERGDKRIYTGGTITITENGITKLVLTDCISVGTVSWPLVLNGPGDATLGYGWGTIDVGNSDPNWVEEFNANGFGQVYIEYSSFSNVIQVTCGSTARYDFTVNMYPASFNRQIIVRPIVLASPRIKDNTDKITTELDMSEINLSFDFSSVTNGGQNSDLNDVYGEFRSDEPGGTPPATINRVGTAGFWEIGTTLSAFTTSVTFDLTTYPGIQDINNIRMLRRETANADWEIYANQSIVGNTIVCTGVTSFSQWVPGTIGDDSIPVELNSFSAVSYENNINLKWQTSSELNNLGFDIERRSNESDFEIIDFVEGAGNSNSIKTYTFNDKGLLPGTYYYRLNQKDYDGTFNYSDVVSTTIEIQEIKFELNQNHPNPFNPETVIEFQLASPGFTKLEVFNLLGEQVDILVSKNLNAGKHTIHFNAKSLSSGTYIYKLTSGNTVLTKKMVYLK